MDWHKHACKDCTPHFKIGKQNGKVTSYCNLNDGIIKDITRKPKWCPLDDTNDKLELSIEMYHKQIKK